MKKLFFVSLSLGLIGSAAASSVAITNNSVVSPTHGPIIILKSFDKKNGIGSAEYLMHSEPVTFKQDGSNVFNAFSSFHTVSDGFGHALIAPHAIKVGNETSNGKTNFVVQLMGREGKTKIGPISCSSDKRQMCYEVPSTSVAVTVNGKTYPTLVNDGIVSLPKGNNYKVALSVNVNLTEMPIGAVKDDPVNVKKAVDKDTNL